jgi:hypothetical protein
LTTRFATLKNLSTSLAITLSMWITTAFMHKVDKLANVAISPYGMALYEESYWRARVLVVDDYSDEKFERYTLQVIENMSLCASDCAPPVGSRFKYVRRRGVMCSGMGRLIRE